MMKMPELQEALLDSETLDALFRDLESHTELVEVMVRGSHSRHATAARPSLEEARALLEQSTCRGVQLRYDYQGKEWWDTLMPTPSGVRLVRVAHEWDQTPEEHP